jgi:hypothetical protein
MRRQPWLFCFLVPDIDQGPIPAPQTLLFFAGFLVRWTDIPNYWKWYAYLDVMRCVGRP